MVTNMDRGIGKILQALKDQHIEENTLVIFHSDNGAAGNGRIGSNGKLRGSKFDEWEGGVRSPAVIKWPAGGLVGGRQIEQVMGYIDLFPTLKEIAGVTAPAKNPLDGISMWPVLSGKIEIFERAFYLGHGALIKGNWKLIKDLRIHKMNMNGDVVFQLPPDSFEQYNLISAQPEIYNALKQAVAPYDAIKAPKELLSKGEKNDFVAPKKWKITKEK